MTRVTSHVKPCVTLNEESHVETSEEKTHMKGFY